MRLQQVPDRLLNDPHTLNRVPLAWNAQESQKRWAFS